MFPDICGNVFDTLTEKYVDYALSDIAKYGVVVELVPKYNVGNVNMFDVPIAKLLLIVELLTTIKLLLIVQLLAIVKLLLIPQLLPIVQLLATVKLLFIPQLLATIKLLLIPQLFPTVQLLVTIKLLLIPQLFPNVKFDDPFIFPTTSTAF